MGPLSPLISRILQGGARGGQACEKKQNFPNHARRGSRQGEPRNRKKNTSQRGGAPSAGRGTPAPFGVGATRTNVVLGEGATVQG